jgi:hypothetical protein
VKLSTFHPDSVHIPMAVVHICPGGGAYLHRGRCIFAPVFPDKGLVARRLSDPNK